MLQDWKNSFSWDGRTNSSFVFQCAAARSTCKSCYVTVTKQSKPCWTVWFLVLSTASPPLNVVVSCIKHSLERCSLFMDRISPDVYACIIYVFHEVSGLEHVLLCHLFGSEWDCARTMVPKLYALLSPCFPGHITSAPQKTQLVWMNIVFSLSHPPQILLKFRLGRGAVPPALGTTESECWHSY